MNTLSRSTLLRDDAGTSYEIDTFGSGHNRRIIVEATSGDRVRATLSLPLQTADALAVAIMSHATRAKREGGAA